MTGDDKPGIAILHHLRWLSALLVAYSHVRQNLLLDYADLRHPGILDKIIFAAAGYGQAGVIVFFVLSGYLVGGKAISLFRSPAVATEWPYFLADRFSRIFVVLWPALLLSLAVLLWLRAEAPSAPFLISGHWGWAMQYPLDGDFSLFRWLNASVLLNEFNSPTLYVDSPLWSLAYEWFYYMAALGVVLALRKVYAPAALAVIVYAALLFAFALLCNRQILVLGLVWALGAFAKIAADGRVFTKPIFRGLGIAAVVVALGIVRVVPLNDFLLGASVAFMIAHAGWAEWRVGERWGAKLAAFSYSFYLVHFPITILVLGLLFRFENLRQRLPPDAKGIGIALATLAGAILFARIFAFFTEDRTALARNALWKTRASFSVEKEAKRLLLF